MIVAIKKTLANVTNNIVIALHWQDKIPDLLVLTIQKLSLEIAKYFPQEQNVIGSTATLLLSFTGKDKKRYVATAWLGDTTAYMRLKNKSTNTVEIKLLTWAHQLSKWQVSNDKVNWDQITESGKFEKVRVEQAGGAINMEFGRIFRLGFVLGGLQCSRSFGDKLWPGVTDIPCTSVIEIPDDPDLQISFLVASDGADALTPSKLSSLAQSSGNLKEFITEAGVQAVKLTDHKDNTTLAGIDYQPENNALVIVADGHKSLRDTKGDAIAKYVANMGPKILAALASSENPEKVLDESFPPSISCPVPKNGSFWVVDSKTSSAPNPVQMVEAAVMPISINFS